MPRPLPLDDAVPRGAIMRPIANAYVVPETKLVAGEYPGLAWGTPAAMLDSRLEAFLEAGITAFVDLTHPDDPLDHYADRLAELAASRGMTVVHEYLSITDMGTCDVPHMTAVLDTIDRHLADGRGVYVHCWGGIGRTGMTVGCWLVRHGLTGDDALDAVRRLFGTMSPQKIRRFGIDGSPQTEAQRNMVRQWVGPISSE
jgi:hypothetical protein